MFSLDQDSNTSYAGVILPGKKSPVKAHQIIGIIPALSPSLSSPMETISLTRSLAFTES
jgi:hypothetical protein